MSSLRKRCAERSAASKRGFLGAICIGGVSFLATWPPQWPSWPWPSFTRGQVTRARSGHPRSGHPRSGHPRSELRNITRARSPKVAPWFRLGAGARGTFGDRIVGNRGYFLNPIFIHGTVAFYKQLGPHDSGIEAAIDLGFTVILARNQEPVANNVNPQTKHEYGLGLAAGLRASYRLDLPALGGALKFTLTHSRHVVGVDVSEKPGKTWALGTTAILTGIEW
jgi:hypothetical protein